MNLIVLAEAILGCNAERAANNMGLLEENQ
jgi:hypothetical protein